ncbi:MAG TPA: surface-adhesin E family protein [Nitrospira sp.]
MNDPKTPDWGTAMKHLFLLTLLTLSHGPVYAGWIAVDKQYQPTGLETLYFDPALIRRGGNRATLWQLTDIKWNSTTRFLSFKTHKEFDCERSRVRILQVIEFSRQMGTGRSAAGFIENGNWQPVEERSVNHALWKAACGKR